MAEDQNTIPFPEYPGPLMTPGAWEGLRRYCEDRPVIRRIKAADKSGLNVDQLAPGHYLIDTVDGT